MLETLKQIRGHISTAAAVLGIVAPLAVWAFHTYAADIVDGLVGSRIGTLEQQARDLKQQDMIQTFQLKGIQQDQADIKDSLKELNRDIKTLLLQQQRLSNQ